MKKVVLIMVLASMLAGCSGGLSSITDQVFARNAQPEIVIETLYEAVFNNDAETVNQLLMYLESYDEDPYEAIEELSWQIEEVGGMNNLNITEIEQGYMKTEVIMEMNEYYRSEWRLVAVKLGEDETLGWVLQEIDDRPVIIAVEEINIEYLIK
ncbi:hypothetical protein JMA_28920 [Jeotgalibacillus malaysiensis]|uniref:DUF4878 domain-containing protein n=1 Tax=Jeotgalibacillus malaysiensis TaxID=1508404 RepID=A0A0B5AW00_9BACL|nr:hypothetical protein [Jeotgalibacillus malaysiensis]AJD92209.1 hypothetical protein JMA_28920 [Jeotgalibacillus malaysiensis]